MSKKYVYNLKTHTLHIEGFCRHTFEGMHYGNDYKCFDTEDDAIAYDKSAIGICKICQKKRERLIKEIK